MYEADGSGNVVCNNPLYDEAVIANPITDDTGIKRSETNNPATNLTVKNTYFYFSSKADNMTAFGKGTGGTFGDSKLGDTLMSGTYWLASRCVLANSSDASFDLREVYSGRLYDGGLCNSSGIVGSPSYALRVVVSVPGSHVNVDSNGIVTLK